MAKYRLAHLLVGVVLVTGCQNLPSFSNPFQRTVTIAKPTAEATNNQKSVLQDFEREIANKLLSAAPTWQAIATRQERQAYVTDADKILNRSGLNRALLTQRQRDTLDQIQVYLTQGEYEVKNWNTLNHLKHLHQIEANPDPKLVKTLIQNLSAQAQFGSSYPRAYIDSSLALTTARSDLQEAIHQLPADDQLWAQNRLNGVFIIDDPGVLTSLQGAAERLTQEIQQDAGAYGNPYYDIRREAEPEQLALDLFALNLEEGLLSLSHGQEVSISGFEHRSPNLMLITNQSAEINLPQLLALPAFEYQSLAFDAAAQLASSLNWPPVWQKSLSKAQGLRLKTDSATNSGPETTLGRQVRELLMFKLAIAEIELALGVTTMAQVKLDLIATLPYSESQLDQLMLNWFASDASMSLSAMLLLDVAELTNEALTNLGEHPVPKDYEEFKTLLTQQLAE